MAPQWKALLALMLLSGCIAPEPKSDGATLLFLLERPLSGEAMALQIAITKSRLQYLGFEVDDISSVHSLLIRARVKGKDLSGSDKRVLASRGDVKVWVENLYAFSVDDAVGVGDVVITDDGLWGVRLNITGKAGRSYTEAIRYYRDRDVIHNYVIFDGGRANLSIGRDLRESSERGLIESVTFIFDKPSFPAIIVARKKFGATPTAILSVMEF